MAILPSLLLSQLAPGPQLPTKVPNLYGLHPTFVQAKPLPVFPDRTAVVAQQKADALAAAKAAQDALAVAPVLPTPQPVAAPVQAPASSVGGILAAIRHCESTDNYTAANPKSTASGAYQFLDSTWAGYGGYARAMEAPPAVQDAYAQSVYAAQGTGPWVASRGCWGG